MRAPPVHSWPSVRRRRLPARAGRRHRAGPDRPAARGARWRPASRRPPPRRSPPPGPTAPTATPVAPARSHGPPPTTGCSPSTTCGGTRSTGTPGSGPTIPTRPNPCRCRRPSAATAARSPTTSPATSSPTWRPRCGPRTTPTRSASDVALAAQSGLAGFAVSWAGTGQPHQTRHVVGVQPPAGHGGGGRAPDQQGRDALLAVDRLHLLGPDPVRRRDQQRPHLPVQRPTARTRPSTTATPAARRSS